MSSALGSAPDAPTPIKRTISSGPSKQSFRVISRPTPAIKTEEHSTDSQFVLAPPVAMQSPTLRSLPGTPPSGDSARASISNSLYENTARKTEQTLPTTTSSSNESSTDAALRINTGHDIDPAFKFGTSSNSHSPSRTTYRSLPKSRRPSLLGQQAMSSPAVPAVSRNQTELSGSLSGKKSSLKHRVVGSLTSGFGGTPDDSQPIRRMSQREEALGQEAITLMLNAKMSRSRSRTSASDYIEQLRDDPQIPSPAVGSQDTLEQKSIRPRASIDERSPGNSYEPGQGAWLRGVSLVNSPQDEPAVIETQNINYTKDTRTGRKMINQYVILREIGRGQHGAVRLGQDLSSTLDSQFSSIERQNQPLPGDQTPSSPTRTHHFSDAPYNQTALVPSGGESPVGASSPTAGGYWAIKIIDRQPRKKLPGLKKLTPGYPTLSGEARQTSLPNEKLRKEIAILKKCRHPNVVRLREVIDAPISKKIYLVLEYCEGGEVKWKADDGKPLLKVWQARNILRDIVLGLEYLHHQGIIHRDIKPANLLYSGDGIVKITDFGVSHYSHVLRGNNTAEGGSPNEEDDELGFANEHDLAKTAGSPAFFAPELCFNDLGPPSNGSSPAKEASGYQFPVSLADSRKNSRSSMYSINSGKATLKAEHIEKRARPPITEAIDVWALGVTLYCFFFAKVPFDSNSEYHLLSIIPVDDYEVPETMGADRLLTGGRFGYKKGPGRDLTREACDAMDLLDKLLQKDPTKRITLPEVKKHPFTLGGLDDKNAWLESTDPEEGKFVTVSNAEVAAAVTNSSSFRDKFRKGMKNLSNRFFGGSSGSLKSRSRSQSIVQLGDIRSVPSGESTQIHSPLLRPPSRIQSTQRSRIPSASSETLDTRPASPRPAGLVRKISLMGSKNVRSVSPLAPTDRHLQSNSGSNLNLPHDDRSLGRSTSNRSAMSGFSSSGRMGVIRRQSTQLVPTTVGDFDLNMGSTKKSLSSSQSVEQLTSMGRRVEDKEDPAFLMEGARRRNRATSNASSAGTVATGLHEKLAKLLSRGTSQKSTSASSHISRPPTEDMYNTATGVQLPSSIVSDLRSRKSADTFPSPLSSRHVSPVPSLRPLPPIASVPLSMDTDEEDLDTPHVFGSAGFGLDPADWEGDLSDDDEDDYGVPLHNYRGSEIKGNKPRHIEDLNTGTWTLDGNGWHGSNPQMTNLTNLNSPTGEAALGLDMGITIPDSAFSPSHVPATIAEAEGESFSESMIQPTSRAYLSPPTSPTRGNAISERQSFSRMSATPVRGSFSGISDGGSHRQNRVSMDRLGRSPGAFHQTFEDEDDGDEEGLEIEVRRGRRASNKPSTPGSNHKLPLPRA